MKYIVGAIDSELLKYIKSATHLRWLAVVDKGQVDFAKLKN